MEAILKFIKQYEPSPRVMFYLMIAFAIVVIVATIAWCVSLFMEVTKKRASKLSIKYGSADKGANKVKVGKLVVQAILIIMAWIFFFIVF